MPQPRKKPLPKIEMSQSIGHRIAHFRKKRGLTQTQLGELIGISQYLISSYEINRLHLSDDMIIRFAQALRVSSDAILGLDKISSQPIKLKYVKRINQIENLSEKQQRDILKMIDIMIIAAETEQSPPPK